MTREELNEKMALMQQNLAAVSVIISQPEPSETNKYGIPDETLQQIQDDTVADLIEMGVL